MVTIAIAEKEGIIAELLQNALKAKGQKICRKNSASDCDYLLLAPDSQKSCDVLLLHHYCPPPCADYITLLNADAKITPPTGKKSLVITYGLNPLATVTASSVSTDGEKTSFLCCLQRSIVTLKGKVIEPQEFPVTFPGNSQDLSSMMGFVCLGLVLSFSPDEFR
ncbi:MAG: hypothetical protein E7400_02280 [Ruminococcaceae bacterium]|nr:hypothetical protein [Oscillospiraceae bacterium]